MCYDPMTICTGRRVAPIALSQLVWTCKGAMTFLVAVETSCRVDTLHLDMGVKEAVEAKALEGW
jgi:hypothetical protein